MVTGLLAAEANNSQCIVGVAYQSTVIGEHNTVVTSIFVGINLHYLHEKFIFSKIRYLVDIDKIKNVLLEIVFQPTYIFVDQLNNEIPKNLY